jgi:hypothetical protein
MRGGGSELLPIVWWSFFSTYKKGKVLLESMKRFVSGH